MTVLELMERLNGEILANKVRAKIDSKIVILAYLEDQDWIPTEHGTLLLNEHSNLAVAEAEAEAEAEPKRRKIKVQVVESVESTDEPSVGLTQAAE
jgi:hypothetical protein